MCFTGLEIGAAAAAGSAASSLSTFSTIAGIAMSGLSAMAQYQAQQQQYQAAMEHRRQQEIQAQKTLNLQVAQQQTNLEQQKGISQGRMAEYARDAAEASSYASAAAAENGVVGLSVSNVTANINAKLQRAVGKEKYNSDVAYYNSNNELKMAQRGLGARLAEIPTPIKPSFLPFALQAGTSALSGLTQYAQHQDSLVAGYQNTRGGYIG